MSYLRGFRVIAGLSGLLLAATGLGGCMSSPTYGTGTSSAEQLVDDIGSSVTIGSSRSKRNIKYAPRPGLVVPSEEERTALVEPQASLVDKTNGQWAESPEEMRARLQQEAEDNRTSTTYRSPILSPRASETALARAGSSQAQLEQFRAIRRDMKGNYAERRYLSDPPSVYRQADPTALQDLGEPEDLKAKRRKKDAAVAGSGRKWWQPFQ